MSIADLLNPGKSQADVVVYEGRIANSVDSTDEMVEVTLDAFDRNLRFGPIPWTPATRLTESGLAVVLPSRGDRCAVGFAETAGAGTPELWLLAYTGERTIEIVSGAADQLPPDDIAAGQGVVWTGTTWMAEDLVKAVDHAADFASLVGSLATHEAAKTGIHGFPTPANGQGLMWNSGNWIAVDYATDLELTTALGLYAPLAGAAFTGAVSILTATSAGELLRLARTTGHALRFLNYNGTTAEFLLQASTDGAAWVPAMGVQPSTGRVGFYNRVGIGIMATADAHHHIQFNTSAVIAMIENLSATGRSELIMKSPTGVWRIFNAGGSGGTAGRFQIQDNQNTATKVEIHKGGNGAIIFNPTASAAAAAAFVGINIAAPTALLHLGSDAGNAASGMKFGSAGDAGIFRSAAGVLQVTGALQVGVQPVVLDNDARLTNARTPTAHTHDWTDITGEPATYPPSAHDHDDRYYTEAEVDALIGAPSGIRGKRKKLSAQASISPNSTYALVMSMVFNCTGVPVLVGWTGSFQPGVQSNVQSTMRIDGVTVFPEPYEQNTQQANWVPIAGGGIVTPSAGDRTFTLEVYSGAASGLVMAGTQMWAIELSSQVTLEAT